MPPMSFLTQFFEWVRQFLPPWVVVRADEQGSWLRWGHPRGMLGPGFHWFWPVADQVTIYNVAYQQVDLPAQTVPTKDGKEVTFSANIGYVITDAQLMELNVQDFDSTLQRVAMGLLARKVSGRTYAEVTEERAEYEDAMTRSLATRVKSWGVEIKDVRITDFCRTRPIRVFGMEGSRVPGAGQ